MGISKSTLSDWLSKFPLSKEQLTLLGNNKKNSRQVAIEKTIIIKQKKHAQRLNGAYQKEKQRWKFLTKKEIELAGILLYWGEGAKLINGPVHIILSPLLVFGLLVFPAQGIAGAAIAYGHCVVSQSPIDVNIGKQMNILLTNMDIKKEMEYWSEELKMPLKQFAKPYIKVSSRVNLTHKGFGHGTCGLRVSNILQKEKIMMAVKAISDNCTLKLEAMV